MKIVMGEKELIHTIQCLLSLKKDSKYVYNTVIDKLEIEFTGDPLVVQLEILFFLKRRYPHD